MRPGGVGAVCSSTYVLRYLSPGASNQVSGSDTVSFRRWLPGFLRIPKCSLRFTQVSHKYLPVLVPSIATLHAKPRPEMFTESEVVDSVVKTCSDGAFEDALGPTCREQQETPGYVFSACAEDVFKSTGRTPVLTFKQIHFCTT